MAVPVSPETELLAQARRGHEPAFTQLATRYRRELRAHCYRMLGSLQDAEDALQESLLAAWKGLPAFEGRSSLRTWLYQIATHACLRLIAQRPRRVLTPDYCPPREDTADLGEMVLDPVWLEPWPDDAADPADHAHAGAPGAQAGASTGGDPAARFEQRETVALAFVAALQHLPGTQRAVLLMREVLEFSAAETAELLDTSVASVNSALQRAQKTMAQRLSAAGQPAKATTLDVQDLLGRFVTAWEGRDIDALVYLLAEDAQFTMPPLPAWFDGRAAVLRFFRERVFATPWKLVPLRANGQPGFACYMQGPDGVFRLGAVNLITLRGDRIAAINGFLDPSTHRHFRLPAALS